MFQNRNGGKDLELDLHGMELYEALEEIAFCLEECKVSGTTEITLVHGYHGDAVLKNYIQSAGFLKEMQKEGHTLRNIGSPNPGCTTFKIV